jgi:hypothetical protein
MDAYTLIILTRELFPCMTYFNYCDDGRSVAFQIVWGSARILKTRFTYRTS